MTVRFIHGDVREELPKLAADFFDCIVTSPPYFGLRDYGTATWDGGDPTCDHSTPRSRGDDIPPGCKQGTSAGSRPDTQTVCRCGARRIDSQIGLEPTLDSYLETMVGVCRELRRVLKPSGVFFLNVADSSAPGKSLYLMPEQLGILLRKDGWIVRSKIIWHKKNCMPESVTDRPTSTHETIWMLVKSERYWWDAEAVAEPSEYPDDNRKGRASKAAKRYPTKLMAGMREVCHVSDAKPAECLVDCDGTVPWGPFRHVSARVGRAVHQGRVPSGRQRPRSIRYHRARCRSPQAKCHSD